MSRRKKGNPFSLFSFQDIITSVSGIFILITLMLAIELLQRKTRSPAVQTAAIVNQLRSAVDEAQQELERTRENLARGAEAVAQIAGAEPGKVESETQSVAQRREKLEGELARLDEQEEAVEQAVINSQAERFDRHGDSEERDRLHRQLEEIDAEIRAVQSGERRIYNPTAKDGRRVWLVQFQGGRVLVARPGERERPLRFDQLTSEARLSALLQWMKARGPQTDTFFLLVAPEAVAEFRALADALDAGGFEDYGFDVLGPGESTVDPETGATL